jgi:hypothetical protein
MGRRHRRMGRGLGRAMGLFLTLVWLAGCHSKGADPPIVLANANGSPASRLFLDVAPSVGLNYHWGHSSRAGLNILETIGHGCAFLDYDNDGSLDILLVGNEGGRLFHNRGNGTFEDVTDHALPKSPPHAHFLGCAVADYDNDGLPDILLTGYGCMALYHNEGKGVFRDVTSGSGLEAPSPYSWATSAAWADVDGDGKLDLYVGRYLEFTPSSRQLCPYQLFDGSTLMMTCGPGNYPVQKGSLYHNEGGGKFRDITASAGLANANAAGYALGALFCDFNGDGLPDLYVANDSVPCDLYLNLGRGRFRNIAGESGTAYSANGARQAGMGVDWGDYDNDGKFDLLVANFEGEPKSLYHNEGGTTFESRSYPSGLGPPTLRNLAFGALFVDVENRGLLDIVFTNGHVFSEIEKVDPEKSYPQKMQLLRNGGDGRFQESAAEAGPDFARRIVGRGMAVGDYDNDGRLDLLVVDDEGAPLLLHNESKAAAHWLSLLCRLAPNGPLAVGAKVTVSAGGRQQIAEVRSGGSYLSTNAPAVHVGLGAANLAETVTIRWPGGKTRVFSHVTADRAYRITPEGIEPLTAQK